MTAITKVKNVGDGKWAVYERIAALGWCNVAEHATKADAEADAKARRRPVWCARCQCNVNHPCGCAKDCPDHPKATRTQ